MNFSTPLFTSMGLADLFNYLICGICDAKYVGYGREEDEEKKSCFRDSSIDRPVFMYENI